jgi:hypothetical protein
VIGCSGSATVPGRGAQLCGLGISHCLVAEGQRHLSEMGYGHRALALRRRERLLTKGTPDILKDRGICWFDPKQTFTVAYQENPFSSLRPSRRLAMKHPYCAAHHPMGQ